MANLDKFCKEWYKKVNLSEVAVLARKGDSISTYYPHRGHVLSHIPSNPLALCSAKEQNASSFNQPYQLQQVVCRSFEVYSILIAVLERAIAQFDMFDHMFSAGASPEDCEVSELFIKSFAPLCLILQLNIVYTPLGWIDALISALEAAGQKELHALTLLQKLLEALTSRNHLYMMKILIELSQGRLDFSEYDSLSEIPTLCKQHLKLVSGSSFIKSSYKESKAPTCTICSERLKVEQVEMLPEVFKVRVASAMRIRQPSNKFLEQEAKYLCSLKPLHSAALISLSDIPLHSELSRQLNDFIESFKGMMLLADFENLSAALPQNDDISKAETAIKWLLLHRKHISSVDFTKDLRVLLGRYHQKHIFGFYEYDEAVSVIMSGLVYKPTWRKRLEQLFVTAQQAL
jgi:hypothetical protein